ncbi:hypothetical protein IC620_00185 [Hazenella sp. IB182357]|uniref:Uncharacterized protein n=1 Tax=Polycladospora coralii TaxID=2771432 RepID=A0A926N7D2_9BACL|nr:hypothetical protein [Polycladospora coralii]MBD1370778.1 hypothetical protein [Polycladospora coralii]MBS7529716.1 hypothetical protein [Polycladospora coralii]
MDKNKNRVTFERRDFPLPHHIESTASELIAYFKVTNLYLPQICSMIQISKRWTIDTLHVHLGRWKQAFAKLKNTARLLATLESGFLDCRNDGEIHLLRGALLESILLGRYQSSIHLRGSFGQGVQVIIHKDKERLPVHYQCNQKISKRCHDRMTVDFGHWDGKHGNYFECKVQPKGFGCKEVMYMRELKKQMEQAQLPHTCFFVSIFQSDELHIRLVNWSVQGFVVPVGISELKLF